ncbi:MAG: non-heme iron oxygenase ferredoxin subunit [Kiritimatiellae bacterium]|nr:non-heme iron oxygenase ferredoxin subunit [Kiritimatiellia bacterium]MDW8458341.1 non-heme iron oxygenase ferredoxin subunit [Verrucomicrobiota bacterium]
MSEWQEVARVSEFDQTDRKMVDLGGSHQIGIFRRSDGFYAISVWCSHQKASMFHGEVTDHQIECPLHGARFCLKTGRNLSLPAVRPIRRYDLKVEGDRIFLKV